MCEEVPSTPRVSAVKWGKRGDMTVHRYDPFNAEPSRAALAKASITANEAFYVRNHGPAPQVDPASWRLRVDGLVERDLELSLKELGTHFAEHEVVATLPVRRQQAPRPDRRPRHPGRGAVGAGSNRDRGLVRRAAVRCACGRR